MRSFAPPATALLSRTEAVTVFSTSFCAMPTPTERPTRPPEIASDSRSAVTSELSSACTVTAPLAVTSESSSIVALIVVADLLRAMAPEPAPATPMETATATETADGLVVSVVVVSASTVTEPFSASTSLSEMKARTVLVLVFSAIAAEIASEPLAMPPEMATAAASASASTVRSSVASTSTRPPATTDCPESESAPEIAASTVLVTVFEVTAAPAAPAREKPAETAMATDTPMPSTSMSVDEVAVTLTLPPASTELSTMLARTVPP